MRAGSGPGALVVAEAADHAALDHDRALRPLFTGDHARRRGTGGDTVLLFDFRPDCVQRHPHQRCGDLGLCFLVIGDPHSRKNRFVERWRVVPDAPRSIFGIPVCTHGVLLDDLGYLGLSMLHCNMKLLWQRRYARTVLARPCTDQWAAPIIRNRGGALFIGPGPPPSQAALAQAALAASASAPPGRHR